MESRTSRRLVKRRRWDDKATGEETRMRKKEGAKGRRS